MRLKKELLMKLRLSFNSGFINSTCESEERLDFYLDQDDLVIVEKAVREDKEGDIPLAIKDIFDELLEQFVWEHSNAHWRIVE